MWTDQTVKSPHFQKWKAVLVWVVTWYVMQTIEGAADLANLALLLVLASAIGGLWLSALESVLVCAIAVMAFNWQFVPPLGTFTVDLRQHAWLLVVMMGVGSMVAWLMGRQRLLTEAAKTLAENANMLRVFGEKLRAAKPDAVIENLALQLHSLTCADIAVAMLGAANDASSLQTLWGQLTQEDLANLQECLSTSSSLEVAFHDIHGYYAIALPLRGQRHCRGATLLKISTGPLPASMLVTAQALCDQTGSHLEQSLVEESARQSSAEAQTQKLRNILLAAISHDYRTPLATILGAATSLLTQADRLTREQARSLASTVVEEVDRLSTMTDNTLQLARLDNEGVKISKDWESYEELIGSAVARTRSRYPEVRVGLRIEPQLPLLLCDAQLIVQLLDNLIDNAVKYGGINQTVEIIARKLGGHMLLAVGDRGPGIASNVRERVFLMFERGPHNQTRNEKDSPRGTGLGLALCRAIVHAHRGSLQAKPRQRGGTRMECLFPIEQQPVGIVDGANL